MAVRRTPFVVILFDLERAAVAAVIEADKLGQLRTGGASGVAAKYLAKSKAQSLGVIGCGWQAESQVACIREACPTIERVVAFCRTEDRLDAFCRKVGAEAGETHRDPAEQDVVVTVTTSRDPVLRGEWLRPGALVCAVGANDPKARELDNAVLERATFVCCDSREQSRQESGDLIEPVQQGVLDWLEVHELHEVVAGELTGRQSDDDIVLFKSNGIAAWDVAIAEAAVVRARSAPRDHPLAARRRLHRRPHRLERVLAEGADQIGVVEQPLQLARCRAVEDVAVVQDLVERTTTVVLPDHVGGEPVLLARALEQERERVPKELRKSTHGLYRSRIRRRSTSGRFAERWITGVDDGGAEERVVVWIERREGAVWAVGRAVNPQHRSSDEPRPDDYVFEGHELDDALDRANEVLEDDLRVSEDDGRSQYVKPSRATSCSVRSSVGSSDEDRSSHASVTPC